MHHSMNGETISARQATWQEKCKKGINILISEITVLSNGYKIAKTAEIVKKSIRCTPFPPLFPVNSLTRHNPCSCAFGIIILFFYIGYAFSTTHVFFLLSILYLVDILLLVILYSTQYKHQIFRFTNTSGQTTFVVLLSSCLSLNKPLSFWDVYNVKKQYIVVHEKKLMSSNQFQHS